MSYYPFCGEKVCLTAFIHTQGNHYKKHITLSFPTCTYILSVSARCQDAKREYI